MDEGHETDTSQAAEERNDVLDDHIKLSVLGLLVVSDKVEPLGAKLVPEQDVKDDGINQGSQS